MFIFPNLKRHRLFPLLKFMFEKCEQATENPDILLSPKETNNPDFNNTRVRTNGDYRQQNEKSSNYIPIRNQNEKFTIDQELNFFLKDNEHILFDKNPKNSVITTQNEKINEINASLDDMVIQSFN